MLKRVLFSISLLIIFLPAFQRFIFNIPITPLQGDFKKLERPVFQKDDWFKNTFQDAYSQWLEQQTGFRNLLVRIYNQIDFSLFSKANAEGVVIGKDNFLFEHDYIRAYLGGDYIGYTAIDKKLRRFKFLQEYLKLKGKDLVLVFEPGKASLYPEKIPEPYLLRYPKDTNNYEVFLNRAKSLNIRHIDLNDWFLSLKSSVPYPLYANTGIHWSSYGMFLAADSLVRYLEKLRNIDLQEMVLDSFQLSLRAKETDYDAATALNLLCSISNPTLAYPVYHFTRDPEKEKISVLTVADSYYWNIFNTRLPLHLFNNEAFWYFNAMVYPDSYVKETKVDSLDLTAEIEKQDVIFLMVTERFLYKFDWDFIDRLYDAYTPELEQDYPYLYEGKIRRFSDWFDMVVQKAARDHVSVEKAVQGDAMYTLRNENKEKYLLFCGPSYYSNIIISDKQWLERVSIKARELGLPLDTILERDSWYLFRNELPALCEIYTETQKNMNLLKKDSEKWQKIIDNPYFLRPEDMLWQVALAQAKGGPQSLALMTW